MILLAFAPDGGFAARTPDAVALYDAGGAVVRAWPFLGGTRVASGVYLADGRVALTSGDAVWVLAPDGAVTVHLARMAGLARLPDGVLFDGADDGATFLDPDTGARTSEHLDGVIASAPDGRRITTTGLAAPGARPVRPAGVDGWLQSACALVPDDPRAWCQLPDCRIGAFAFDGTQVAEVPGCAMEAVGPGGLVVSDHAEKRWIGLDGAVRATFPREARDFALTTDRVAWGDRDGFHVRTLAGDTVTPALPTPPPRPAGIVATDGRLEVTYGPDGAVLAYALGAARPRAGASDRARAPGPDVSAVNRDGETLLLAPSGAVLATLPRAVTPVARLGDVVLVHQRGGGTAVLAAVDATGVRWERVVSEAAGIVPRPVEDVVVAPILGGLAAFDVHTGEVRWVRRELSNVKELRLATEP